MEEFLALGKDLQVAIFRNLLPIQKVYAINDQAMRTVLMMICFKVSGISEETSRPGKGQGEREVIFSLLVFFLHFIGVVNIYFLPLALILPGSFQSYSTAWHFPETTSGATPSSKNLNFLYHNILYCVLPQSLQPALESSREDLREAGHTSAR